MPKVIYVTGAPAAGKSSTLSQISARIPTVSVWEYGEKLTEHVAQKSSSQLNQTDLRSQSSQVVTTKDVAEVDAALLAFVENERARKHILVDSHPVTKESYGFRVTPFSLHQFSSLRPDEIWMLFVCPQTTRQRIENDPGGRPMVTEEEARTHTLIQASVAATYGMSTGCPIYMFDTSCPQEELVERLIGRLT